jgi:hypothetical protein
LSPLLSLAGAEKQALHIMSPFLFFFQSDADVVLHSIHDGFVDSGMFALKNAMHNL